MISNRPYSTHGLTSILLGTGEVFLRWKLVDGRIEGTS